MGWGWHGSVDPVAYEKEGLIRILASALANKVGGSRRVAVGYLTGLAATPSCQLIVLHCWSDPPSIRGARLVRVPLRSPPARVFFELAVLPVLPLLFRARAVIALGNIGGLIAVVPTVVLFHNLNALVPDSSGKFTGAIRRRLLRYFVRITCAKATRVMLPARWMATDVAVSQSVGRRSVVIPIGCDVTLPALSSEDARRLISEKFGVSPGYILAVGDLYPHKNYSLLLDAVARSGRELPLVLIAGTARRQSDAAAFQADISRLRLPPQRVLPVGEVTGEVLAALYTCCRGVVCPSLLEAAPSVPVEARHFRKPVVASRIPAHQSLVHEANLFTPSDVHDLARKLEALALGAVPTLPPLKWTWTEAGASLSDLIASL